MLGSLEVPGGVHTGGPPPAPIPHLTSALQLVGTEQWKSDGSKIFQAYARNLGICLASEYAGHMPVGINICQAYACFWARSTQTSADLDGTVLCQVLSRE